MFVSYSGVGLSWLWGFINTRGFLAGIASLRDNPKDRPRCIGLWGWWRRSILGYDLYDWVRGESTKRLVILFMISCIYLIFSSLLMSSFRRNQGAEVILQRKSVWSLSRIKELVWRVICHTGTPYVIIGSIQVWYRYNFLVRLKRLLLSRWGLRSVRV